MENNNNILSLKDFCKKSWIKNIRGMFKCYSCLETFIIVAQLLNHLSIHDKPRDFECAFKTNHICI